MSGHAPLAAWLARARGWTRYVSEPRYKLVVSREAVARGMARRKRTGPGKKHCWTTYFPAANQRGERRHQRLPDELFSIIIARYYWGGDLPAEDDLEESADVADYEYRAKLSQCNTL